MKYRNCVLAALALPLLAAIGCSSSASPSSTGAGGSAACEPTCKTVDYTKLPATPVVSFKTDVFAAIMRPTCNASTCHGVTAAKSTKPLLYPPGGLYLGPGSNDTATTVDAALLTQVVTALKGTSKTAPSMAIVSPNSPDTSFLMLKLTGCENTKSLACTVQSADISETKTLCGDPMPPKCFASQFSIALTDAQIATFATWIKQGALDN